MGVCLVELTGHDQGHVDVANLSALSGLVQQGILAVQHDLLAGMRSTALESKAHSALEETG